MNKLKLEGGKNERKKERKIERKRERKNKRKKKKERKIIFLAILVIFRAVELQRCVKMVLTFPLDTHREKFPGRRRRLNGRVVRQLDFKSEGY